MKKRKEIENFLKVFLKKSSSVFSKVFSNISLKFCEAVTTFSEEI